VIEWLPMEKIQNRGVIIPFKAKEVPTVGKEEGGMADVAIALNAHHIQENTLKGDVIRDIFILFGAASSNSYGRMSVPRLEFNHLTQRAVFDNNQDPAIILNGFQSVFVDDGAVTLLGKDDKFNQTLEISADGSIKLVKEVSAAELDRRRWGKMSESEMDEYMSSLKKSMMGIPFQNP